MNKTGKTGFIAPFLYRQKMTRLWTDFTSFNTLGVLGLI